MSSFTDIWVTDYRDALPGPLRLHELDTRYRPVAQTAMANGWDPTQLAEVVTGIVNQAAGTVNSPTMYALRVMERLADSSPARLGGDTPSTNDPDDWRGALPVYCSHPGSIPDGLAPNQCWQCRLAAGDPLARFKSDQGHSGCRCGEVGCTRERGTTLTLPQVAARSELLKQLSTSGLSEDHRADHMLTLITTQRKGGS